MHGLAYEMTCTAEWVFHRWGGDMMVLRRTSDRTGRRIRKGAQSRAMACL